MNFLAAAAYQESRFAEFTNLQSCGPTVTDLLALTDGYPAQACDIGYGIMQLTQGVPGGLNYHLNRYIGTPTQDMIWNWVSNLNAGASVMVNKYNQEITSENNIIYNLNNQNLGYLWVSPTTEQRQMNVWQRYNGGLYWVWSLCATQVNGVCTAGWVKNPNISALPKQCKKINSTYVYADCVKYWSDLNPQWCSQ